MDKQEELHKQQEFEPKMPNFDEIGWLVTMDYSGSTAFCYHELLNRTVRVLQLKKSGRNL